MRLIPNEYNDEVRRIDEEILALIQQRKKATAGRRFSPPAELLKEWAEKYGMDEPHIGWILHTLNVGSRWANTDNPIGELRNVVPILKKSVVDDCEYMITHAMQHDHASLVTLEIRLQGPEDVRVNIHPRLMLEIVGEQDYTVSRDRSRGSGHQVTMLFRITPPLPDDFMEKVRFALIPMGPSEEVFWHRTLELVKRVDFQ